jgi:hypothetical protein
VGAIVGVALGSVVLVLIALLALVFCIKKHQGKEIDPLASRGSRPADTYYSRFSVPCIFILLTQPFEFSEYGATFLPNWFHVGLQYL